MYKKMRKLILILAVGMVACEESIPLDGKLLKDEKGSLYQMDYNATRTGNNYRVTKIKNYSVKNGVMKDERLKFKP